MTEVRSSNRQETRARVVGIAARLLAEQGPAAVTTRAVAQAAGLQTPVIYRLFEDKEALLTAVAEQVFEAYVAGKVVEDDGDPIAGLRAAWDLHIGFGLAHPALFSLFADPSRVAQSPAAAAGEEVLLARVRRIAAIGRLRVPERRAVELIRAAGTGAVLTLISMPPAERDPGLAGALYDAVMRAVLTGAPAVDTGDTTAALVAFRTLAPTIAALSEAERALLAEWLDRATRGTPSGDR
jgi:AcrR family transcriptional regulator